MQSERLTGDPISDLSSRFAITPPTPRRTASRIGEEVDGFRAAVAADIGGGAWARPRECGVKRQPPDDSSVVDREQRHGKTLFYQD